MVLPPFNYAVHPRITLLFFLEKSVFSSIIVKRYWQPPFTTESARLGIE